MLLLLKPQFLHQGFCFSALGGIFFSLKKVFAMSIKFRFTVMSFLQFFVWGAWLITIGTYWFMPRQWSRCYNLELFFLLLALSSLFMPAITGIIADRWMNAEKFMAFCISCMALFYFMYLQ